MTDSVLPANVTETWLPGPDGVQFYTRTYTAASPHAVVVFVHGFSGHCVRYEWMHGVYATRGITVFTFDQRGFGRTALDAEAKTGHSLYGKTSWPEQLCDIEWWIKHVQDRYPSLPVFLMGHSMVYDMSCILSSHILTYAVSQGGALALAFATRTIDTPSKETVASLAGVVASSPFLLRATPTARHVRFIGWLLSFLIPNHIVHTHIDPNVSTISV